MHHEEGLAAQRTFKKQTQVFIDTDDCPELLVLNSRDCADDSFITTVRSIEAIGTTQYQQYCKDVITSREKSIRDTNKKNSLPLFKTPKCKVQEKVKSITASYGPTKLDIANQQREGDSLKFFSHENQVFHLHCLILVRFIWSKVYLNPIDMTDVPEFFQCKILDGAAVVHFLPTASVKNFAEYADKASSYVHSKEATREHRGHGTRTKVSEQTNMPRKWSDFLHVSKNKQGFFLFSATKSLMQIFLKGILHQVNLIVV